MARSRGILNRRALDVLASSSATSGVILSLTRNSQGSFTAEVLGDVVQMSKGSAITPGAGRLVIANGDFYIPEYTTGIGAQPGSGYTTFKAGIYQVDAVIGCSGSTGSFDKFTGAVLVDGVPASGTETLAAADAQGFTDLKVIGVVHAASGQVINVGAKSVIGTLTAVGAEDFANGPGAVLRIVQLPSTELEFRQ